jgi:uncharacterized protein YggU (UPF0235/DUF167 family)
MASAVRLGIKVVPKASRDQILGWSGGRLRVAVTAAPERDRANAAATALVAAALQITATSVRVVAGHRSRHKLLEIEGLEETELLRRLGA